MAVPVAQFDRDAHECTWGGTPSQNVTQGIGNALAEGTGPAIAALKPFG